VKSVRESGLSVRLCWRSFPGTLLSNDKKAHFVFELRTSTEGRIHGNLAMRSVLLRLINSLMMFKSIAGITHHLVTSKSTSALSMSILSVH